MMSAVIRSGVHWIRWKETSTTLASVRARVVFPVPGSPSRSTCPPAASAVKTPSTTDPWPTNALPISRRIFSKPPRNRSSLSSKLAMLIVENSGAVADRLSGPVHISPPCRPCGGEDMACATPTPPHPSREGSILGGSNRVKRHALAHGRGEVQRRLPLALLVGDGPPLKIGQAAPPLSMEHQSQEVRVVLAETAKSRKRLTPNQRAAIDRDNNRDKVETSSRMKAGGSRVSPCRGSS